MLLVDKTIDQLCFFAALTKSGLTEEVLSNVVAFMCAQKASQVSLAEIQEVMRAELYSAQPITSIKSAADTAVEKGWLTCVGERYEATQEGRHRLSTTKDNFEKLEHLVKVQWKQALEDILGEAPESEELWQGVRAQLAVLVFRHGSTTASLLANHSDLRSTTESIQSELNEAAQAQIGEFGTEIVLAALTCFFDLNTQESLQFIEQLLNSAFSYSALSIAPEAADYLSASLQQLDIFLDTNFIFGLLELHDSPHNHVCQELVQVVKDNNLPFRFYFFHDTLQELVSWLETQTSIWLSGTYTSALSRALSSSPEVPRFVRAYHEENAREPLDLQMYLDRYADLAGTLEAKGLRLFRQPEQDEEPVEVWGERVADYEHFLKARPTHKPRTQASLRHDAVLLGVVDRRRTSGASPLTSRCVLLTVDSRLIAFSRARAEKKGDRTATLYPSQLLQLITPFITRTPRSARVLAESINIAVFQTIEFDRSRAVAAVAKHVRGIKNLSEEDAKQLLSNQILLTQLTLSSEDQAAELVESALVAQAEEAKHRQAEAESELELARTEKIRIEEELEAERAEKSQLLSQLKTIRQEALTREQENAHLIDEVASVKASVAALKSDRKRNAEYGLALLFLTCLICAWLIPFESVPFLERHANILALRLTLSVAFVLAVIGLLIPRARHWAFGAIGIDVVLGIVLSVASK